MKKKVAIILAAVLTCSMSMTAVAAPSRSVEPLTAPTIVISDPEVSAVGSGSDTQAAVTMQPEALGVVSARSAILDGTTFKDAVGKLVNASYVKLVINPATLAQTKQVAEELAKAMTSNKVQVLNNTGRSSLSLTDKDGNLNVIKHIFVSLQDQNGNYLTHTGAIAPCFAEYDIVGGALTSRDDILHGSQGVWSQRDILGDTRLREGETLQALYQRADGSWVAVPIIMRDGAVAISLPSFSGVVKVVFVVAKGESLADVPAAATKSPRT